MKYLIIAATITAIAAGQSYNGSFLNLFTPISGTSGGDFEFSMNHRFFGAALKNEPFDSFFGLDNGANVRFGMRYYPKDNFHLGFTHTRLGNINTITAGWTMNALENLDFAVEAGYTSVKVSDDREGAIIATGCLEASFLNDRLRPVINYAFDGYRENNGAGLGLDFQVAEKVALFGEYFPSVDESTEEDCFAFGCRYNTWGHQFLLALTNSPGIGIYEQLPGSYTGDLFFALSIRRLF